jgi:tRNA nucleotidyltransferase (CCA-adding enzyme)
MTNTQTNKSQEVFVVGGAVRDTLLGRPVKDVDFVVVGSTAEEMLATGFHQVGADFPVFLDHDGQEFALARTERKTGSGYHGFETDFDPSVTLQEDLFRRDLTINAMAVNRDNWEEFQKTHNPWFVIDPFNGMQDLKNGILRHVSEAFADDPVRILRIARFAARYHAEYDFSVAPETLELMTQMVKDGEVDHLVPERVWAETGKALMEDSPQVFFFMLSLCGALKRVMPFIDSWAYQSLPFESAAVRNLKLEHRLMLLMVAVEHDVVEESLRALRVPINLIEGCVKFNKLASLVNKHKLKRNCVSTMHVVAFDILNELNAWKCQDQLREMGVALSMFSNVEMDETFDVLMTSLMRANAARFDMLTDEQKATLKGKEIGEAISALRKEMLRKVV